MFQSSLPISIMIFSLKIYNCFAFQTQYSLSDVRYIYVFSQNIYGNTSKGEISPLSKSLVLFKVNEMKYFNEIFLNKC